MTDRDKWLESRKRGIGASDAACILGLNPWKSNVDLWLEKTGRVQPKNIDDNSAVKYGKEAEQYLRMLFALDFPQYLIDYDEFGMLSNNPNVPFAFATLDGVLTDINTKKHGILEIKTTEIKRSAQWNEWDGRVPQHYYVQVVHQLMSTGFEFSWLKAQIKWYKNGELNVTTRHYPFTRKDLTDDIVLLERKECEFWECVESGRQPHLILPEI